MSNSLPRTMRRKAAMSGSTSSNANSKVRGLTVPSLSDRLLPCVRVTVFSLGSGMRILRRECWVSSDRYFNDVSTLSTANPKPTLRSHRRLRHAGAGGERLFGGILESLIRRQHHRGRAHLVVSRIDAGGHDAFFGERLGRPHEAVARHDDAVVGGGEIFFGAVADRSHALLQRGVLDRKAGNSAEGLAGLLGGAIDQIVVVLVGERPIGPGHVLAVHARAAAHGLDLARAERANGMKVVAPGPAILVVDRDPEVTVDRVIAARGDHGEAGNHPRRGPPAIIAVLGVAAGADIESARLLHDFEIGLHVGEIVLIAPGALEQRVGAEIAAVQERDVARIEPAPPGVAAT